ncbi:hypothetical protein CEXT_238361 [Caerostris extrusa]|uniref:Uncharacterized protein n=1 Tax=Caerostris extrusa TaxID=172846 RepID=A0AAV4T5C1_CAEEX|nr:hypothetical protein CEXT_238361 [Caerostris extrusa]
MHFISIWKKGKRKSSLSGLWMRAYISPDRQIDVGIWRGETIYFHGHVIVRNGSQLRDSTEYRCILCECGGGERMQIFSFQQFLLTLYDHALYLCVAKKSWNKSKFRMGEGDFTYGIRRWEWGVLGEGNKRCFCSCKRKKKWCS